MRCLFGQGDSDGRDSTSSRRYLQTGKLRHKPGSATALRKGCPFPQHPTGHTEGLKVTNPPPPQPPWLAEGIRGHRVLPGGGGDKPCLTSRSLHSVPRSPPSPQGTGTSRTPSPQGTRASRTASPQGTGLSPRGPRSPAGDRGPEGPGGPRARGRGSARSAPLAPLPPGSGGAHGRGYAPARAARCRGNRDGAAAAKIIRGGGGGEWTPSPPIPRIRAHPGAPHCPQPPQDPPVPEPSPGHPPGPPHCGDTARGGGGCHVRAMPGSGPAALRPNRTRFPRVLWGSPPRFLVLLPPGSLSGTEPCTHSLCCCPSPLCHPRGCRGNFGAEPQLLQEQTPQNAFGDAAGAASLPNVPAGKRLARESEQPFPPGRAGEGREGAATPKAFRRGAGQLPLTAFCPSASSQAPGLMPGVTGAPRRMGVPGAEGAGAVGEQAGCGWGR